jgi:hypothetical protein
MSDKSWALAQTSFLAPLLAGPPPLTCLPSPGFPQLSWQVQIFDLPPLTSFIFSPWKSMVSVSLSARI